MNKIDPFLYHLNGKISLGLKAPLTNQKDLSLAYTPGVAKPCLAIENEKELSFAFTNRANMVAVISDGTAVLGLGDIGPTAGMPVMEGKCVLFKAFSGIDAFPIVLENVRDKKTGKTNPAEFIKAVKHLASNFGGINLEDVASPACFEIEEILENELEIPVFHDDQWGTAIITLAAIKNYLLISKKKIDEIKIVINGAGAAGIRIADMIKSAGGKMVLMVDRKGVIHNQREDLNSQKKRHSIKTDAKTLTDAMKNADVFIGVSGAGCLKEEMVTSMNVFPAIFAMANPEPEIMPESVHHVLKGKQYVMATGRSDYPNQINNVLGFPYIFEGALAVGAKKITTNMKIAAADALAKLAREKEIPVQVKEAYRRDFQFGVDYIIPTPFDPRISAYESNAVAQAALIDGVSRFQEDISSFELLEDFEGKTFFIDRPVFHQGNVFLIVSIATISNNQSQEVPISKQIVSLEKAITIELPNNQKIQIEDVPLKLMQLFIHCSLFNKQVSGCMFVKANKNNGSAVSIIKPTLCLEEN